VTIRVHFDVSDIRQEDVQKTSKTPAVFDLGT
jgi:hypothetical protein